MPASSPHESLEWVNKILLGTWPYASRFVERTLRNDIQPMVNAQLPGPLASFAFGDKVTLGETPLRVERIDTSSTSPDAIKLEVDVVYDGNAEIDCSVLGVPFGIRRIGFRGRMALSMRPLIKTIPLVGAVQVAFYTAPKIDMDFSGAASVADFTIVESTLVSVISNVMASMAVLPNKFLVKLDPTTNFLSVFVQPEGVLRLAIAEAKGLKAQASMGGLFTKATDAYITTTLGALDPWTTETVPKTGDPVFGEKRDFILHDLDQQLVMVAHDSDVGFDAKLGSVTITARGLLDQNSGDVWLPLLDDSGEATGAELHLTAELLKLTSLDQDLSTAAASQNAETSSKDAAARSCAVLTMIVNYGRGLPEASAPAVVLRHGDQEFKTNVVVEAAGVDPRNPLWERQFELLLNPEALETEITLQLVDGDNPIGNPETVAIADIRAQEGLVHTVNAAVTETTTVQARFIIHACA